jgi:hypothetical protein
MEAEIESKGAVRVAGPKLKLPNTTDPRGGVKKKTNPTSVVAIDRCSSATEMQLRARNVRGAATGDHKGPGRRRKEVKVHGARF